MRVTNNATFIRSSADLEAVVERLSNWQRQVSSGLRVEKPSDDPAAISAGVRERNQIAAADQYTEAADSANSRLVVIDQVLDDVLQHLTSAQVTILSARGSVVTQPQRDAAATELEGLRDALMTSFNTSFRGTYPFSGSAATVAPYFKMPGGAVGANAIDQTPISVDIDRNASVQITYSADAITQGADAEDLFQHLERAIAAVRGGDEAEMQTATLGLDAVFARATQAQSTVGASMKLIETEKDHLSAMRRASSTRIAELEHANLAQAISGMNQEDAAYRAALGAITSIGRTSLMDYLR